MSSPSSSRPTTANALGRGEITPFQQMISAGTGAMLVSLSMTPLDVVKIRLQAQEKRPNCLLYHNGIMDHMYLRLNGILQPPPGAKHTSEQICNCTWYNRPKYFNGTLDAIVKISRVEGVGSLWSGLGPTLVLALPTTVVYFTTYENARDLLEDRAGVGHVWGSAISGAAARIWACTLVSPLELIRTKMQSQKMAYFDVRKALNVTVRQEGIRGLWKGYTANLLRDVPFSAIYWPVYETLRPEEPQVFWQTFLAGAVAGTAASTLTLPMDVIKTQIQMELGERMMMATTTTACKAGRPPEGVKASLTNRAVARDILARRGWRGLFAGLTPRIIKVAPACAIMISSYEHCKAYFLALNNGTEGSSS